MIIEDLYTKFLEKNLYPRHLPIYSEKLINFSSNDYLGLARHPLLLAQAQERMQQYGVGSVSSRSVTGNFPIYSQLEQTIASALNKPAALLMGSGFQTNFSVLEALLDEKILGSPPVVFIDKLVHASMLQGVRLTKKIHRFQHNNLQHLEILLKKYSNTNFPKFILVESLYSMEGDYADLPAIQALARQHQALLYVDDAHTVGLEGPGGWGRGALFSDQIDIIMGTFSKAFGSFGGYIACSETIKNYLVNKCKGLIYSTGLSPAILGAIEAAIHLLPTLDNQRKKLQTYTAQVHALFKKEKLDCGNSQSHIIPWIIGDAAKTLKASALLEAEGILGVTIRPPSVPLEKSRIRFCLSASHSDEEIFKLQKAIRKVAQML